MASRFAELLREVEIFEKVGEADLEKIGVLLKERRFHENQIVCKQGDPGDALYVVADGRIKVFVNEGGSEKVLAFFGEGQVFGEMSLLTGEPRAATAVAVGDTRVLALPKADFDAYLATNVNVMREMMRLIALRQAQTNARLTRDRDGDVEEAIPTKGGKVYAVFGPRGGSGKTMVAVNLAVSFALMHPDRVGLVDLSLTFGHCSLLLNLVPRATLAGTSPESFSRMDREAVNYYMSPHSSTLKVLTASGKPEEGEAVTGDHVKAAIDVMKRLNLITVIDTCSTFSEATIAALEGADKVILLCTPELTTLRDVRECQRIFNDLIQLPREKVYYVMNQTFPFKPLGVDQFEGALEQSMNAEIPFANEIPSKAAIKGEAFVQTQPGSSIAKAIESIAKTLEAEGSPTAKQPERRGLFRKR